MRSKYDSELSILHNGVKDSKKALKERQISHPGNARKTPSTEPPALKGRNYLDPTELIVFLTLTGRLTFLNYCSLSGDCLVIRSKYDSELSIIHTGVTDL